MLEARNLSVGYNGENVLKGINFTFKKGMITSIIGLNGSGKTTLIKALAGLIPLNSGSVIIDGEDASLLGRNRIARKISYLAQRKNIPDMTVMQLVLHGRFPYLSYPRRYSDKDKEIALQALEMVGLASYKDQPLYTLSGGMGQNAYIAMALAQDTDYILLDEPATFLDIPHQIGLMDLLRVLAHEGKGIITIMHDLPMAFDNSGEIALLDGGGISLIDPFGKINPSQIRDVFGVGIRYSKEEQRFFYDYR